MASLSRARERHTPPLCVCVQLVFPSCWEVAASCESAMSFVIVVFHSIGIARLLLILLLLLFSQDLVVLSSKSPKLFLFLSVNLLVLTLLAGNPGALKSSGSDIDPAEELPSRAIVVRDPMIVAQVSSGETALTSSTRNADVFVVSSSSFTAAAAAPALAARTGCEESLLCYDYNHGGDRDDGDGAPDDSLALTTTQVFSRNEDDQRIFCKAIVPVQQGIIDEEPRTSPRATKSPRSKTKKTVIKKRKVAAAAAVTAAAAIPDMYDPPGINQEVLALSDEIATSVDVGRLSSCSIEDFNKVCSTIIKLRRQEWQLR